MLLGKATRGLRIDLDLAAWRSLVTLNKQFLRMERDRSRFGVDSRECGKTGSIENVYRQLYLRGYTAKGSREMENGSEDVKSRGVYCPFVVVDGRGRGQLQA